MKPTSLFLSTCIILALVGGCEQQTKVAAIEAPDAAPQPAELVVASNATATGSPILEAPETEFNFGERDNTESVVHEFVIKNTGTGTLELGKPRTSCGCTVANAGQDILAPGEETTIKATLSLANRQGATVKTITVPSNDPNANPIVLKLSGTAIAPVELEPKQMIFGTILDDNRHEQVMTVKALRPDISFNVLRVDGTMPGFETEVETVVPGKEFKIKMFNPEPLPVKSHYGRFTIVTDNPKYTNIQFAASANVLGELRIQPDTITLLDSGVPDKRTNIAFQVLPGRTKDFILEEVIPPLPEVEVEITPLSGNSNYLVKLNGLPQDMRLNGKAAILKTNLKDRPEIEVPFVIRQTASLTQSRISTPAAPAQLPPLTVRPDRIPVPESDIAGAVSSAVVYVSAGSIKNFKVLSVEGPADTAKTEISQLKDNYYMVKLTGLPRDASIDGKKLIITTDAPGAPKLEVPVQVIRSPLAKSTAPRPATASPASGSLVRVQPAPRPVAPAAPGTAQE